jgi:hypothetical protein
VLLVTLALKTLLSISQNGINQIKLKNQIGKDLNKNIINASILVDYLVSHSTGGLFDRSHYRLTSCTSFGNYPFLMISCKQAGHTFVSCISLFFFYKKNATWLHLCRLKVNSFINKNSNRFEQMKQLFGIGNALLKNKGRSLGITRYLN